MADTANPAGFPHLQLASVLRGKARLFGGGGKPDPRTAENKANRPAHAASLGGAATSAANAWEEQQRERAASGMDSLTAGVPLLLQVDPTLDLDALKALLNLEIVSEQSNGFVIVATEDVSLANLQSKIAEFATGAKGSAVVASVYEIHGASTASRISAMSSWLAAIWPEINEDGDYVVDVGVACGGLVDFREAPTIKERGTQESDKAWASRQANYQQKLADWAQAKNSVYAAWDELKDEREQVLRRIVERDYAGSVLDQWEKGQGVGGPPDSFTMRIRITGKGLKDLVLNYPFIFEVVEPDSIILPQHATHSPDSTARDFSPISPPLDAPSVGLIDSGIEEAHRWISPAVDRARSICLLPGETSVGDDVAPNGHGTRVAGAVLFGEQVPLTGALELPFWIRNARVLDSNNNMPSTLAPHRALRGAVLAFRKDGTRVFNQSVNAHGPCRLLHMSSWAAEIDTLSDEHDVLVVQSCGNLLPGEQGSPLLGVLDHVAQGRSYPDFLDEPSSRVANPGQSLQALTVGSVAYCSFDAKGWKSFASRAGDVSAFSRSGPGIWEINKPDVVEFGGDYLHSGATVASSVSLPSVARECYPSLLRATAHSLGDAVERDTAGTSFSAPKVTHIVGQVQKLLPHESTLLYRALVVQSARWPDHALGLIREYEVEKDRNQKFRGREKARAKRKTVEPAPVDDARERLLAQQLNGLMRRIGYGVPDVDRATHNSASRVTLISAGERLIIAGACDLYEVRVPASIRAPGNEYEVMVEVTLSYVAAPRRTRRTLKRYLSVWLDWITNAPGQSLEDFKKTALTAGERTAEDFVEDGGKQSPRGKPLRWTLGAQDEHGIVRGVSRNDGTVQKDWAVTKLDLLPESFCIAVRGHKGWSRDPEAAARYALVVSFEVLGGEVEIYEEVRVELESAVFLEEVSSS